MAFVQIETAKEIDIYSCLSSDTKSTNVDQGSICYETDTGKRYELCGSWVETQTSGAIKVVQSTVTRSVWPNDIYETTWLLGDPETAVTVATGTPEQSVPWDIGQIRRDHGSVCFVLTGAGTIAVDTYISRNGIDNKFTIAAATISYDALAAGTYVLALNNANIPYGHYIDFLLTASGANMTAKVFGMGRNG